MASVGASRSSLLRETNRLAGEILRLHKAVSVASDTSLKEAAVKASNVAALAAADAELAATKRAHAEEAANDAELSALQRGVAELTTKLAELIASTKRARPARDRAREEALVAYYMRSGVDSEVVRAVAAARGAAAAAAAASAAAASSAADGAGGDDGAGLDADDDASFAGVIHSAAASWTAETLALLGEADALWRRVSSADAVVRDMVEAALSSRGLTMMNAGDKDAHFAPPAALAYASLGARAAAADARRGLTDAGEMEKSCEALRAKVNKVTGGAPEALTAVLDAVAATVGAHAILLRASAEAEEGKADKNNIGDIIGVTSG